MKKTTISATKIEPEIDWAEIDTVLLDMDGTLLDKHFDDYFWETHVPEVYAAKNKINPLQAEEDLLALYKAEEGRLNWTDLDFWSDKLGLDLATMKEALNHLIVVHPYVCEFLEFCRSQNKDVHLVTNAHPKTLAIKMAKTGLTAEFTSIICADELGLAKEEDGFWESLASRLEFAKDRCLLADDNEAVLEAAHRFGLDHLVFVSKSSSRKPVRHSGKFPSIIFFKELLPEE
ncbi:MAG: HAD family hydrolase [Thermodesulfobacteriota bacterium]